ncbi:hypothetical protein COU00_00405 [Candidatus Falkowbacteria bacterium CG10_big_fil_rev_8_21_14_0_10_43_11]|uniref:Uncharacterized protein n=1 Tax=Candidatus Falkowbacteria bacterium CG10_big_fil_rev_8_21_14_0_10_43_11 TaxID=1974568 RepID=A0A2M6WMV3_9BACT|nr:MAG: hypothetical protein COU00_00405 [Candidatus Falkowbacteria bacterium CG10_big_fil_rev_8_21_14_0_10_43_11]
MAIVNNPIEKKPETAPALERPGATPEKQYEQPAGFERPKFDAQKPAAPSGLPSKLSPADLPPLPAPGISLKDIERVLSEDLEEIYFQLPPDKQQEFKKRGEDTARKIKELLAQTKIKAKKIAALIFAWLKIIPGVNKFFLEKESKIKTDEVLKLKDIKTQEH